MRYFRARNPAALDARPGRMRGRNDVAGCLGVTRILALDMRDQPPMRLAHLRMSGRPTRLGDLRRRVARQSLDSHDATQITLRAASV